MGKVFVFLADGFEEIEGLTVVDMLRRAEIPTVTVSIGSSRNIIGAHRIEREIAVSDHTWVHQPDEVFEFSCNIKGHRIYRLDIKAWGGDGVG